MKFKSKIRNTDNDSNLVDDHYRRGNLNCSKCPPNKKENTKRRSKHGSKKKRKPWRDQ